MSEETSPSSVMALIVKDGLVLTVTRRDKPDDLALVGGKIEPSDWTEGGHDYQAAYRALCREVKEEAGVTVHKAQWLFERVRESGKVIWYYQVFEWGGEPSTTEPGVTVSWRRPSELLTKSCTYREYNARLFEIVGLT